MDIGSVVYCWTKKKKHQQYSSMPYTRCRQYLQPPMPWLGIQVRCVTIALSYNHCVYSLLDHEKETSAMFQYAIHQMSAVPAASDALARYTGELCYCSAKIRTLGSLL